MQQLQCMQTLAEVTTFFSDVPFRSFEGVSRGGRQLPHETQSFLDALSLASGWTHPMHFFVQLHDASYGSAVGTLPFLAVEDVRGQGLDSFQALRVEDSFAHAGHAARRGEVRDGAEANRAGKRLLLVIEGLPESFFSYSHQIHHRVRRRGQTHRLHRCKLSKALHGR